MRDDIPPEKTPMQKRLAEQRLYRYHEETEALKPENPVASPEKRKPKNPGERKTVERAD